MSNFGVDITQDNLRKPTISLKVLYEGMPATSGCENCHEHFGEDAIWCCRTINPSMYYVEFLKVWQEVQKWPKHKKRDLMVRAIINYLDTSPQKGCVFWGEECMVYDNRPFACRMYGVIPQESWDKRVASLREREGEDFPIRPQCDKVVSENPITEEDENKWFEHTRKCEVMLGVDKQCIDLHDIPGGSYRTFHDHLLLEILEPQALNRLTEVKLSKPSREDIESFAEVLTGVLEAQL